jgi:bacteriocin-like protein
MEEILESKVDCQGSAERILGRQLARELSDAEMQEISGGMMKRAGTSYSGPCCCADDCCLA